MLESLLLCRACAHGVGFHTGSGCEVRRCACPHDKHKLIDRAMSDERIEHRTLWAAIAPHRALP